MSDMSGGNSSMNNHNISQQYCDYNNGNVSCVNVVINCHTLSRCDGSSSFNDMDGDVENGDVTIGYGYTNSHTVY